ncbi:site-2 protease family protein [Sporocytophaga myxococcoides]|uniref:site-2 protease family protein n=1 Tax=Sporocytophaga myxococcoides TaxID=153721 RepID=UPI0004073011|nr:site-2 protease family protein [Sporocytophaga myxococcoides]
MRWSLYIGKFAGTKVLIHWTFLLLLLWIGFSAYRQGATTPEILLTVSFILTVFICVLLHEFGHALTAKKFGIATKKITLLPIGGLASIERIPEDPKKELWITLAGPMVNVIIALVLYLILGDKVIPTEDRTNIISANTFFQSLFWINVTLVIFNIIPAFPMDGGRILRALLAIKIGRFRATKIASRLGQFVAVGFFFLGLFYSPLLMFIAAFIFFGAYAENMSVQQMEFLRGHVVKEAMMKHFITINPQTTIKEAADKLLEGWDHNFIITENSEIQGIIKRESLFSSLRSYNPLAPVKDIMKTTFRTFDEHDQISKIYHFVQEDPKGYFPVLNNGVLTGVINLDNLNEFVMIQSALKY